MSKILKRMRAWLSPCGRCTLNDPVWAWPQCAKTLKCELKSWKSNHWSHLVPYLLWNKAILWTLSSILLAVKNSYWRASKVFQSHNYYLHSASLDAGIKAKKLIIKSLFLTVVIYRVKIYWFILCKYLFYIYVLTCASP